MIVAADLYLYSIGSSFVVIRFVQVKVLLLTNPGNPIGRTRSYTTLLFTHDDPFHSPSIALTHSKLIDPLRCSVLTT